MRRFLRIAGLLFVNLVVLAVFAELAAAGYYYLQRHELYYARSDKPTGPAHFAAPALTEFRVSPYFGFMRAPGVPLSRLLDPERMRRLAAPATQPTWTSVETNNYGFLSRHDYPFAVESKGAFVIGIFGGSVAQWFALQGEQPLIAALKAAPQFRDREMVLLNLAAGGYKQPQQLLLLDYFLALGQRLDYAINIDGFNETTLARMNLAAGVAAAMPSLQHMAALARLASLDPHGEDLDRLAELIRVKRRMAELAANKGQSALASGFVADEIRERTLTRRYDELTRVLSGPGGGESLITLTRAPTASPASADEQALGLWVEASRQMRDIARARGIGYLHVVHPNQYFGHRTFGVEEARIALNPDSPYRKYVETGYPQLLERVPTLRGVGVRVLDATSLFEDETQIVYADDCCHYNQRGNDKLARAIAEAMLTNVPAPPNAGPPLR